MTKEKGLIKRKIIKSNNLIESSYKLTMSENRLIDLALEKLEIIMLDKNLSAEDVKNLINCNNFEEIKINISDYAKEYSIKNNSLYKDMSEVAKKLYERSIIYIDDNDNLVTKRWVITCIYQERDCTVAIQFHPTLVPDLILLKGSFTKFDFDVKKRIKSYYGCRIYELLKQYQTFGQRIFHVDQLRFVLGVEDDEYPNYSNFKQRIIAPSIEQINKHTDLYCEFEEIKNKRKVEKIKFKFVTQKVDYSIPQNLEVLSAKEIFGDGDRNIVQEFRDLLGVTISVGQIDRLINKASKAIEGFGLNTPIKEYIKQKKGIVDKYAKDNHIKSYVGAIMRAVEENWTLTNKTTSTFNNFEQRTYDFNSLEKKLLGWENSDD